MAAEPFPEPARLCERWLQAWHEAVAVGVVDSFAMLFADECHWRDLIALTGQLTTLSGRESVVARLWATRDQVVPGSARLAPGRMPPHRTTRAGRDVIEALIAFDTVVGPCFGVLRLDANLATAATADKGATPLARCWILLTALDSVRGHEERLTRRRASAADYQRDFGGENWLDKRNNARAFADRDPTVIVIGAGQAGLSLAARLGQVGVDTLIIDRQARIGDNWRKRYHALTLHNEVHVNHLPYLPFPPTWPVFIPKDMLANWFEHYVEALELNAWCATELVSGEWRDDDNCWVVRLRCADGRERAMRPRHLVFATGVSSIPVRPKLPGLAAFAGTVMHSSQYANGATWRGRRAVVVGTGNSGHDVAQDLHASGAEVTLMQRGATYVVSVQEAQRVYSLYNEEIDFDDCDLLATAMPFPVLRTAYRMSTAVSRAADADLLSALSARGFRLDMAEDDAGFQMRYLQRGGGYYFNVGASNLIVEGRIGLIQADVIERVEPQGLRRKNGSLMPVDLIVFATGYQNQQDVVRTMLGDAVADRIGPVWGFDAEGELRNMWRPTAQPGLWFTAGSLAQCRIYSKYLALQILMRELQRGPGADTVP